MEKFREVTLLRNNEQSFPIAKIAKFSEPTAFVKVPIRVERSGLAKRVNSFDAKLTVKNDRVAKNILQFVSGFVIDPT